MRSSKHAPKCPAKPIATYRLQLNSNFTLSEARKIVPYLKELGISHVYSSPLLKAKRDSSHCYDVVSHTEINPQITTPGEFEQFCRLLAKNGMGLLLDIVPNHMSTSLENKLWFDVLEKGLRSEYANFFDIDWAAPGARGKVILPILGDSLEEVFRSGDLRLVSDSDSWVPVSLELYGKRLPISIESYIFILRQLQSEQSNSDFERLADELESSTALAWDQGKLVKKIGTILSKQETQLTLRKKLERARSDWGTFREFLDLQHYILEYWRDGIKKINYRRFVYVNDLVAIHAENKRVFDESHDLIRDWLRRRLVQALRVDHVDGLREPTEYLKRLQGMFPKTRGHSGKPHILIEKILLGDENLRSDWKVSGTTGYEFIKRMNGLFVSAKNKLALAEIYGNFTGMEQEFERVAIESKRVIVKKYLQPDIERLIRIAFGTKVPKHFEQVSSSEFRHSIEETALHFPVYRTYAASSIQSEDSSVIKKTLEETRMILEPKYSTALSLLSRLLLIKSTNGKQRSDEFCRRFQQLTPIVAAKGLEDTAFYRHFPLSSLNEVGGEPSEFGVTIQEFHSKNLEIARRWPSSMLSSSTHDTKWSEDSRARLDVLSELPDEWRAALQRWSRLNLRFKTRVGRRLFPTRNDEYLLYESLLATLSHDCHPISNEFIDRVAGFMKKASKEEKLETDWIDPDPKYDAALNNFVRKVLDVGNVKFLDDLNCLLERIRVYGIYNSLSQILLKLTCPGVPDIYQGCETWNFRMVDPDNRAPVDFVSLSNLLREISRLDTGPRSIAPDLFSRYEDGGIKMYVLKKVLDFRKNNQELFNSGGYVPILSSGKLASNVICFGRSYGRSKIIVAVPRFFSEICDVENIPTGNVWDGTTLEVPSRFRGEYRNIFTGEKLLTADRNDSHLRCSVAFKFLPFCLLSS